MFSCDDLIHRALAEDLGGRGDVTSALVVPASARAQAVMRARESGVAAGMDVSQRVFDTCGVRAEVLTHDGTQVTRGDTLMRVTGPARAILAAERVALNLACRLSGIATATAVMVAQAAGTKARIAATRKTTPGLRALEKGAVEAGGGLAHRYGLYDAILIKDNHIAVAGGVGPALAAARAGAGHMLKLAVEVDTLAQLEEVLATGGADSVLLDNMDLEAARAAVALVAGRFPVEYSGSARPGRVAAIAATGVDIISSGWLTHSAPALDIGLDVEGGITPA